MKVSFGLLFLIFFAVSALAQPDPEISPERLREFREVTQRRVNDFQLYLSVIGDKSRSMAERSDAIDLANGLFEVGAMMEVSGRDGKRRTLPVTQYFKNLLDLPYQKVEINYYDTAVTTDFEKGPDGYYHAKSTYYQNFRGYGKGGKLLYESKDRKDIAVTGKAIKTIPGKQVLKIFFGDISISETQVISKP